MNSRVKLVFIGGGNMAASLIGGLVAKGHAPENIVACDPVEDARKRLESEYGIQTSSDNFPAVKDADVVVLAVKPQVIGQVAKGFAGALKHRPLIISIVAGIPVSVLNGLLVGSATGDNETRAFPLVRCMPNTPALLQAGATGLFATTAVSEAQKKRAEVILAAVGTTAWVSKEEQIDAVTAVSGSGPAYFFLVMEAMMAAGEKLGLPIEVARDLTLQTAMGASRMALESDVDIAELRRRVTSPGGTTEAALAALESQGLEGVFENALRAAFDRAREMGEEAALMQAVRK